MKRKKFEPYSSEGVTGIDINDLATAHWMMLMSMLHQIVDVSYDPACKDIYLRVEEMIGDYRRNCPAELSYAFMAWAATVRSKPEYPKDEIKRWLKEHTKLNNEAMERISIVANWDKKAGRRRK
ncbi:MAG: hypothetical protein SFU55_05755 [Methylophilus sp.]|nr:hypothetical protein [Methylophilus sp.]